MNRELKKATTSSAAMDGDFVWERAAKKYAIKLNPIAVKTDANWPCMLALTGGM